MCLLLSLKQPLHHHPEVDFPPCPVKWVHSNASHRDNDLEWIEQNKERLLQGYLTPLALNGQVIEIDTTTPHSFDYAAVLQQVHIALSNTRTS